MSAFNNVLQDNYTTLKDTRRTNNTCVRWDCRIKV